MTQIEKQIADKVAEMNEFVAFAKKGAEQQEKDLVIVKAILKKYKITEIDTSKSFINKAVIDDYLVYRARFDISIRKLTDRQKTNLHKALRDSGLSCYVGYNGIEIPYSNEKK